MKKASTIWRRSAGSVISLANRYRFDIFFRTECILIGLQSLLALLTLGFVIAGLSLFYDDISSALISNLSSNLSAGLPPQELSLLIVEELEYIKQRALIIIASVIIILTLLFGYFIVGTTLKPARATLASQKQFIGNVAHELRTPLSIIKTNIEVLLIDELNNPELERSLRSNVEELDRISHLINNLLSLNKLVYADPIEFHPVDLGKVIDSTIAKLTDSAEQRNVTLTVRKREPRIVHGNDPALEQVASNIIKNAIRYTPSGGNVVITVEPDSHAERVKLIVEDSGVGIKSKDLFHIFEPFYRADEARARESGGSGLGLTIVDEIVKIHHGKIEITSVLGKGTRVTVWLPQSTRKLHKHKKNG